ncbi:MAG: 2-oxoacid:acceptor oxidoreductase family protein [Desulfurococcales archaeon]|nr:2-oxoacid:acceptor oxidoreductase family protein [Desulfurococcales archaeon]
MLLEIIFFGRGGQGGVTAANILVEAATRQGLYGQGFPFFGAERRGAPVKAFARISDNPILRHGMFNDADVLVLLDHRLSIIGLTKDIGIRDNGIIIVNAPKDASIPLESFKFYGRAKIYRVDATEIAVRNKLVVAGWPVVNTAILGAFSRATGIIDIENMIGAVRYYFRDREHVAKANAKAVYEAYEETSVFKEVEPSSYNPYRA